MPFLSVLYICLQLFIWKHLIVRSNHEYNSGLYAGPNFCQSRMFCLVNTWMSTVSQFTNFKCVWRPEMDYKHTCDTIYTHFWGKTYNIYGLGRPFLLLRFLPVHPYFYPFTTIFTRPNDECMGLCIKLWYNYFALYSRMITQKVLVVWVRGTISPSSSCKFSQSLNRIARKPLNIWNFECISGQSVTQLLQQITLCCKFMCMIP